MEYGVEPKAKGKGFLRVTGILEIIGGGVLCVIGVVILILAIIGVTQLGESFGTSIAAVAVIFVALVICLAGAIIELITGIVGTKNAGKPERYKRCKVLGIIVLILEIISLILSIAGMIVVNTVVQYFASELIQANVSLTLFPWWVILIEVLAGIAIPVLFLIGVSRNKHSYLVDGVTSGEINQAKAYAQEVKAQKKADARAYREERFESAKGKAADFAADAKDKASDFAADAKDKAADFAADAKDKASGFAADAREKAVDFAADVKVRAEEKSGDKVVEAKDEFEDLAEEVKDKTDDINQ